MKTTFIILLSLILSPLIVHENQPKDIVYNFYSWYSENGYKELSLKFVELQDGNTGLDFSTYDELLDIHGFSKELIALSKERYSDCEKTLKKISFNEFKGYTDLDQFANIGCSFLAYPWFINSMEPMQYFSITSSKKINDNQYEVMVELAYRETDKEKYLKTVTVKYHKSDWRIVDIK